MQLALLLGKSIKLCWTKQGKNSCDQLKQSFITATLRNPRPQSPFHRGGGRLQLWDSSKLMDVEENYDVGNHELLAIKGALEEWYHWLKGAKVHCK